MRVHLSYASAALGARNSEVVLSTWTGLHEFGLRDTSSSSVVSLLRGLWLEPEGHDSGELALPAREELLFHLYRSVYGDRILSSLRCERCEEPYDLSFSVAELLASCQAPSGGSLEAVTGDAFDEDVRVEPAETTGWYRIGRGPEFRLPTGQDENSIAEHGADALIESCVKGDKGAGTNGLGKDKFGRALAAAIGALSPILDIHLEARCPHCSTPRSVPFSMQHYLLRSILNDRPLLLQEIHYLASTYGWSLDSILSLTRADRKSLAALVSEERAKERAW